MARRPAPSRPPSAASPPPARPPRAAARGAGRYAESRRRPRGDARAQRSPWLPNTTRVGGRARPPRCQPPMREPDIAHFVRQRRTEASATRRWCALVALEAVKVRTPAHLLGVAAVRVGGSRRSRCRAMSHQDAPRTDEAVFLARAAGGALELHLLLTNQRGAESLHVEDDARPAFSRRRRRAARRRSDRRGRWRGVGKARGADAALASIRVRRARTAREGGLRSRCSAEGRSRALSRRRAPARRRRRRRARPRAGAATGPPALEALPRRLSGRARPPRTAGGRGAVASRAAAQLARRRRREPARRAVPSAALARAGQRWLGIRVAPQARARGGTAHLHSRRPDVPVSRQPKRGDRLAQRRRRDVGAAGREGRAARKGSQPSRRERSSSRPSRRRRGGEPLDAVKDVSVFDARGSELNYPLISASIRRAQLRGCVRRRRRGGGDSIATNRNACRACRRRRLGERERAATRSRQVRAGDARRSPHVRTRGAPWSRSAIVWRRVGVDARHPPVQQRRRLGAERGGAGAQVARRVERRRVGAQVAGELRCRAPRSGRATSPQTFGRRRRAGRGSVVSTRRTPARQGAKAPRPTSMLDGSGGPASQRFCPADEALAPAARQAAASASVSFASTCLLPNPRCECVKTRRSLWPGRRTATPASPPANVICVEPPPRSSAPTSPRRAAVSSPAATRSWLVLSQPKRPSSSPASVPKSSRRATKREPRCERNAASSDV